MSHPTPVVIATAAAQSFDLLGSRLTVKVSAQDTQGAFSVVEFQVAPDFRAPPQFHRNMREDWWAQVLDGTIAIEAEGQAVRHVAAGDFIFVKRGTSFRWWNPEPKPARWLLTYAPGGFEGYFIEAANAVAEKRPRTPQEIGALAAPLWARFGVEVSAAGGAR